MGRARLLVRAALADLTAGDTVLVGLSGGPDSLALAAAVAFVAPRRAWRWGAVVVDHGLQAGSAAAAETAAGQARRLGADLVRVIPVTVGDSRGAGPEGAARTARYAVLREQAAETAAAAVLLAHTRDDQAETVLLGLARGSGARSLSGMRPVAGVLRRPFLALTRTETEAVCAAEGLVPWADPHNTDPAHARSRVRAAVLPVLEAQLGPGLVAALARTADLLRADADLLDTLAAELLGSVRVLANDGVELEVPALAEAPPALRRRVLRRAALEAGAARSDLSAGHVDAVEALVIEWHGQRGVDLPGRVRAVRSGAVLRLAPATPSGQQDPADLV